MKKTVFRKSNKWPETEEFEVMGLGHFGYVKEISLEEAIKISPEILGLPEGLKLYALHDADGSPMTITDSKDAAIVSAFENDLHPLSLH